MSDSAGLSTIRDLDEAYVAPGEREELKDGLCFLAASAAMRRIQAEAAQVARINVPVLILGETGTGKEVVARLIHKLSPQAHRTFLKVNCAALPDELLESELFGYEAGAFTGANRPKPGMFELANKGTILLDEIGEMSPRLQAKLLQVLQDHEFYRLGGRSTVRVDVRILAATNVDIQQAISAKKFREDLYYRLNAFTLQIPPLRERREEIPLLLKHFASRWADRYDLPPRPVSPALLEACLGYSWPGNLRELESAVKRYLILGDELLSRRELEAKAEIAPHREVVPKSNGNGNGNGNVVSKSNGNGNGHGDLKSLVRNLKEEAEREVIARTLEQTSWHRKEAAQLLSISYKALLYKMRQYSIGKS